MSAIFTLKKLINNRFTSKKKTFACFIDLKRAFDNVDRGILFKKLHSLGINEHFLQMMNHYYNNSEMFVKAGKEWIGDSFKIRIGLPQGQELSPILFALFIADYCPNTNGEDDVGILDCMGKLILIRAIFFADDLVLLASSRTKLCELMRISEFIVMPINSPLISISRKK